MMRLLRCSVVFDPRCARRTALRRNLRRGGRHFPTRAAPGLDVRGKIALDWRGRRAHRQWREAAGATAGAAAATEGEGGDAISGAGAATGGAAGGTAIADVGAAIVGGAGGDAMSGTGPSATTGSADDGRGVALAGGSRWVGGGCAWSAGRAGGAGGMVAAWFDWEASCTTSGPLALSRSGLSTESRCTRGSHTHSTRNMDEQRQRERHPDGGNRHTPVVAARCAEPVAHRSPTERARYSRVGGGPRAEFGRGPARSAHRCGLLPAKNIHARSGRRASLPAIAAHGWLSARSTRKACKKFTRRKNPSTPAPPRGARRS